MSFSTGNPVINIAIFTWCWLLNEETVKLSYSSFEWDLWYPLKVGGRPSNVYIWHICVGVPYCVIWNIRLIFRVWWYISSPTVLLYILFHLSASLAFPFVHFIWLSLFHPSLGTSVIPDSLKGLFHLISQTHLWLKNGIPCGARRPIKSVQTDTPASHYSDHNSLS